MTSIKIETEVHDRFSDYLRDESRKTGNAEGITFPSSEDEVLAALSSSKKPITIQGARTGITGGAVPSSGIILNLSNMSGILAVRKTGIPETPYSVVVQPGVTLKELRSVLTKWDCDTSSWSDDSKETLNALKADGRDFFFPPDPTEDTASIGGMLGCNASGARSFKYGPTRNYVRSIRAAAANGSIIELKRGRDTADGRRFSIGRADSAICGEIPNYTMPKVKNAAGYFAEPDMDLVDLFIGAEGTLGVITGIELLLRPAPSTIWAVMTFLPDNDAAGQFVASCKKLRSEAIAAIEYFDPNAIDLLRNQKEHNPAFSYLPQLSDDWGSCVYVELDGDTETHVEETAMQIAEVIEKFDVPESATWMATKPAEIERMKMFRHALPEAVNLLIDSFRKSEPEITKLGTDFAVPSEHMHAMLSTYTRDLAESQLRYVIFGHIGNNHLHVNILPKTMSEYERGKALYLQWAGQAVKLGGTVSAEHGIGKIKTAFLAQMYGTEGIQEMKRLKSILDPDGRLNPGNLFEEYT